MLLFQDILLSRGWLINSLTYTHEVPWRMSKEHPAGWQFSRINQGPAATDSISVCQRRLGAHGESWKYEWARINIADWSVSDAVDYQVDYESRESLTRFGTR